MRSSRTAKEKVRLQVYVSQQVVDEINAFRRRQPVPQDISKTIRQLISLALKGKSAAGAAA